MRLGEEVMLDAAFKQVEALSEGQITHDVKGVEVDPQCDIEWLTLRFIDAVGEKFGVFEHSVLIIAQGYSS